MRLTRRGVAVLVLAVLLLVFGPWGGYPFLRALGGILLGAVLAAVLLTARGPRVDVRRSVHPDRVERGRPALASLWVGNPGGSWLSGSLATDTVGGAKRTIRVRALPPGTEAVYHYELPTDTRGRLTIGPLAMHRVDPFGLARNRLSTGEAAALWVHPRQLPARAPVAGHPRHHHEGVTTDALRGSMDLRDVREYAPGDEVRHLHWKATARTGRLMVRDLADPQQSRFTLLLDTRPDALSAAMFEEAVDLTASLLSASARVGHHSRLVTSSGLDLTVPGGVRAMRRMLDELCELRQSGGRDDAVLPGALSTNRSAGGCLVVVTDRTAGLASLALLRRLYSAIVVVTLAAAGTRSTQLAGVQVLEVDSAEQAVRRWNEVFG